MGCCGVTLDALPLRFSGNPKKHSVVNQKDARPANYNYLKILKDFLGGSLDRVFNGEIVYPRQLEIHLPSNKKVACDFHCYWCQGGKLDQTLAMDEEKALRLVDEIGPGKCEYYIYGGAYTEPLLNPYMMDFLRVTKKHKVLFGIHTNGSQLKPLEEKSGFLSEAFAMMEHKDYISVSLDAGRPESHMKTKNLKHNVFDQIIEGIRMMTERRDRNPERPAVRVCYLLNKFNSSAGELEGMVRLARELRVDSLRFSIPYDHYGKNFGKVRDYKKNVEIPQNEIYEERLRPIVSRSPSERPYVFYFPPENQDVDRMNFRQCVYTYYQITLAADGNVYRCSSIASPTFSHGIVGPIPDSKREFEEMIIRAQDARFDCNTCWKAGARCNRMALEINSAFNAGREEQEPEPLSQDPAYR